MSGIDFSNFPKTQEMIRECDLEDKADHIIRINLSRSETAVLLAEMHLMCKAGLSTNIPLRKRSSIAANFYYDAAGKRVHAMAAVQALEDLDMTFEDLSKLFAHKEVIFGGGQKYV